MEQPLVSVITVTRNRAKLLGRCIDSVLGQTYRNVEHIIVDGASEDETDDVINSYHDDRLRYIKLESNWPIVKTMRHGISMAKGKYLTFLDSDDEYVPTKIEKQVALIETLPEEYGMVYCWMTYFDSSKDNAFIKTHKAELRGFVPIEAAEKPTVSGTPTFLFRKKAFEKFGGWAENDPIGYDWELGARYCQTGYVDYVPESLVNVYINHMYDRQSTQMRYDKGFLKKRIAMHEYQLEEFKETFNKRPSARWYNYMSLAFFCLKDHDVKKTIKYSWSFLGSAIRKFLFEKIVPPKSEGRL